MDYPLATRIWSKKFNAIITTRITQHSYHFFSHLILQRSSLVRGGNNMVNRSEGAARIGYPQAFITEHAEGLWASHLVYQMQADKELILPTIELTNHMAFPDFLV